MVLTYIRICIDLLFIAYQDLVNKNRIQSNRTSGNKNF